MPLFQVAVIECWVDEADTEKERLLLAPTAVIAKDSQTAALSCLLKNQEAIGGVDPDDLQVIVVPFV